MKRVLVARLDSIGDVLLAGPAIRAIAGLAPSRERPGPEGPSTKGPSTKGPSIVGPDPERPEREVTLLCGPQGAAAGHRLPGVSQVLVWSCPWISDPAPPVDDAAVARLGELVAQSGADEAVILTSFHQSPLPLALLLRLRGVRRITGASVDFAGSLLDVRLRPGEDFPEDQPEPVRALTIARAAGYDLADGDRGALAVRPGPDMSHLTGTAPYVVVHPGAAVPSRAWPVDSAAHSVDELAAAGLRVLVTGGPAERELTRTVAGDRGVDLGGRTDLAELSDVLAGAQVTITGNTGPAHLSAAVGTPVVSLFSPVVPAARWAPYGVPVELLGDQQAPCKDSRARTCPVPGHPCLSSVTPQEVTDACLRLVAARRAGASSNEGKDQR